MQGTTSENIKMHPHYCEQCNDVNCNHIASGYVLRTCNGIMQPIIIRLKPRRIDPLVEASGQGIEYDYNLMLKRVASTFPATARK